MIGKEVPPSIGQDTQFQPGQSGNPAGKPKGTKNLSTWIQTMLNEEKIEGEPPIKAIVQVAIERAKRGSDKDREWLAKYGYGTKITIQGNQAEADDWFNSIDDDEKELADEIAAEFGDGTQEQEVAPDPSLQD